MIKKFLPAVAGIFVLSAGLVARTTASDSWNIGDIFVAVDSTDPVAYRAFAPDGSQKSEADLVDNTDNFTTGCAIDPTVADGDLFTTTFSTPVTRFSGLDPHGVLDTFDVADVTSAPLGPGVPALPSEFLTPIDPTASPAIESVVFDQNGDLYLGAQLSPGAATTWLGHGWIIKMSRAGTILGWWQADAGSLQYQAGSPQNVHGVDWMDLSQDQHTIYYTSEDGYIRSYDVSAQVGTALGRGPAIPIHLVANTPIQNRAYSIRILPPGDPANGFLVATSDLGVSRVDASGQIIKSYFVPGTADYFSLDITPDGASFWTETFEGQLVKFHIASGSVSGPFDAGTSASYGVCVKHEYTAAQNVCYATDLNGNAIPDGTDPTGFKTQTCKLPPTPDYCLANPNDPDCVAPGTPALSLQDLVNKEGDQVNVQLQATDPLGQGLTWQVTNLPPGQDASNNPQPLQVNPTTGLITGYIQFHASATSPFIVGVTVTNAHGQSATGHFTWTITQQNAPPTLAYTGGPRTVTVGFPFNPPIVMTGSDPDLNSLFLTAAYTQYSDPGFTTPSGAAQDGLPFGMALPLDSLGRNVVYAPDWTIALGGDPQVHATSFPEYFRVTITACDCDGNWDHSNPTLVALHHVSQSVNLTITNQPPSFTVSNQLSITGTPLTYAEMKTSANDPDGANHLPVTFAVVSGALPPGLALQQDAAQGNLLTGVVAGTPTAAGTYPITVRGSDKYGAFLDRTFTWDVVAAPVDQVTLVNTFASCTLPQLPNGHAPSYAVTGLPAGLSYNSSTGVISGTPTSPTAGAATVNVTTTDTLSHLSVTGTFHWTVNAPPTLTVTNQTTQVNTPVRYPISASSPNGNLLSYAIGGLPGGLSMDASGLITGTPAGAVNAAPVTVTVTDTVNHLTATAGFTWTVIAPPVFTVSNQATLAGTPVSLPINATSPNGDPVTYSITGLPAGLTANAAGVISGAPPTPAAGATVTVTVTGTVTHLSTTQQFAWSVYAAPIVSVANQTTLINTSVNYPIAATPRPATDALTYTVSGLPSGVSASPVTGLIAGTPTIAVSAQTVTVTVTDTTASAALHTTVATTTTFTWSVITNRPPVCSVATAAPMLLWPPNHNFVPIVIGGVTDPDGDEVSITISSIWQDELVDGTGDGHTPIDGLGVGTSTASVRAERSGDGAAQSGRLYQINFSASDGKAGGTCTGSVFVGVPHDQGQHDLPVDTGVRYDSVTGAFVGITGTCTSCAPSSVSFNMQSTAAGNVLWLSSVIDVKDVTPPVGSHIYAKGGTIRFGSTTISVPDAVVTFAPAGTVGATAFDTASNTWRTTVPVDFAGNVFLAGVEYTVPAALRNNTATNWTVCLSTDILGLTLNWQGSAAAYPAAHVGGYNTLGVKPLHSTSQDSYHNGDQAGTPENVKVFVVSGGTGGGGSNFTGSYSSTASVAPAAPCQPPAAPGGSGNDPPSGEPPQTRRP